ncbi:MAG: hypothetical protein ACRCWJ_03425 [Casimicrobium sp.]
MKARTLLRNAHLDNQKVAQQAKSRVTAAQLNANSHIRTITKKVVADHVAKRNHLLTELHKCRIEIERLNETIAELHQIISDLKEEQ